MNSGNEELRKGTEYSSRDLLINGQQTFQGGGTFYILHWGCEINKPFEEIDSDKQYYQLTVINLNINCKIQSVRNIDLGNGEMLRTSSGEAIQYFSLKLIDFLNPIEPKIRSVMLEESSKGIIGIDHHGEIGLCIITNKHVLETYPGNNSKYFHQVKDTLLENRAWTSNNILNAPVFSCLKSYDFSRFSVNEIKQISVKEQSILKVYPNPAVDYFQLQFSGRHTMIGKVHLIDKNGMLVRTYSQGITSRFDLKGIEPGIYFVQVESMKSWFTQKLILLPSL